jgi:hypothetical protein
VLVTLYDERTLLGGEEYEKILQLLLWSSDQVCLPPQVRVRSDIPEMMQRLIATRINELADVGMVTSYQIEDIPTVRAPGILILREQARKTVSQDDYRSLFQDVRETTLQYRGRLATPGHNARLEGVTEYVTLQSHLWTLGLAGLVGSGQALTSDRRSTAFIHQLEKGQRAADLRAPVVDALMKLNDIGALRGLATEDIIKLRRYLPQVRQFVTEIVDSAVSRRPLAPVETLRDEVVQQVMQEYLELYLELQRTTSQRARSLAVDIGVSVLGYLYRVQLL